MIQNRDERQGDSFNYKEKNTITIPESSMDYIVELLSSNLYDKPYESFLREAISNAYDANIESGNLEPIKVKYSRYENYVEIIDNGIGIPEDRFKDVYLSLGSSTKRNSNTQIGSFGLGRLACLACSNNVFIDTTYYDDAKQKYIRNVYNMYKPNIGISVDLVISEELDNASTGTTVRVYTKISNQNTPHWICENQFPLLSAKGHLLFYDLDDGTGVSKECKLYTQEYDTFIIANAYDCGNCNLSKRGALIGNIMYEGIMGSYFSVSVNLTNERYGSRWGRNYNSNIAILPKFEIGDIEFTPSRDSIKLSPKTKESIIRKQVEVATEIFTKLIPINIPVQHLTDNADLIECLNGENLEVNDSIDLFIKPRESDPTYKYIQYFALQVYNSWNTSDRGSRHFPAKKIRIFDTTEGQFAAKEFKNIVKDIIYKKAKLVITNRSMNNAFVKEKESDPEGIYYVSIKSIDVKSSKLDIKEINAIKKVIKYLHKYCYSDVISFESKKNFDYVRNTSSRKRSEKFKISVIECSDTSNYNYNTRMRDEYYDIEDSKVVPLILCDKFNDRACTLLRYIFRFYNDLPLEYQMKLFPTDVVFGICAPSVVDKLSMQGKAINFMNYLASDNLVLNIIKLANKIRRKSIYLTQDNYNNFNKFGISESVISNLKMLSFISRNIYPPHDTDLNSYLDFKTINYSKFGNTLPLLKDMLYNEDLLRNLDHDGYNMDRYFIFKYTKLPKTRIQYGRQ